MMLWLSDATRHEYGTSGGSWTDPGEPKGCLHTTEGSGWPSYDSGAKAPHATVMPIPGKGVEVRQHTPFDRAARALRNPPGGVQTNRDRVYQFELIGTCAKGGPGYYWPDADDAVLADLYRKVIKPVSDAFHIPLIAPPWLAYPASYGQSRVRMSGSQFDHYTGWLGHQHVPENCVHPDTMILTGDMRWKRAGDLMTGDRIVGFDEESAQVGSTAGRRFRESFAVVHGTVEKDCYRVATIDGTEVIASADHKWLVNLPYVTRGSRIAWVETRNLDPAKHRIKGLGVEPWDERQDKEAGWLAGAIDRDNCWVNRVIGKTTASLDIAAVEHLGPQPVVSLETTTRTYVADGLLCHNTHGDPGAFPWSRMIAAASGPTIAQEDAMPTPRELWGYEGAGDKDAWRLLRDAAANSAAALGLVKAMAAKGGALTPGEIEAAVKAGVDAAFDERIDAAAVHLDVKP